MLEFLKLENVGPSPEMAIDFQSRLNLLTGDNSLGKSFLLDLAWWVLTGTWTNRQALPRQGVDTPVPSIHMRYGRKTGTVEYTSQFRRESQHWPRQWGRPANPGMVIYAQVDGGFSVWDPARNYWKDSSPEGAGRPRAFLFSPHEVWDGLSSENESSKRLCNGLIHDWASWQREKSEPFEQLARVLKRLSPSLDEPLTPGPLKRVSLDDVRDQPTLKMPYDQAVPLIHASSGIRRIVALAYLLVWTWQEHIQASKIIGESPTREIIFLVDEIEAHLHPQWQRRIVPALLEVMNALTGEHSVPVQLITATHSPLVLASIEPQFQEDTDRLFHLSLHGEQVVLGEIPWAKQGDAVSWLVSDAFGLQQGHSLEAERAIDIAQAFMRGDFHNLPTELNTQDRIHAELKRVLAGHDPFWPRWIVQQKESTGQ